MLTHMVFFVVKLLNYFPVKGGVSNQYSPKVIMAGKHITYKHYCMPFGLYCQVHKDDSPQNSMAAWTQGASSLRPSPNQQGEQIFFSLTTGCAINWHSWTPVIDRVNQLTVNQPQLLTFYDHSGCEIGDADLVTYDHAEPTSNAYEIPGVVGDAIQIPRVDADGTTNDPPPNDDIIEHDLNHTPPQRNH